MRYYIRKGTTISRYQSGKMSHGGLFRTTKDVVYDPADVLHVVMGGDELTEPIKYSFTLPEQTKGGWQYITVNAQFVEVITGVAFERNENWGQ